MSRDALGNPLCVSDVLQAPALDWSYARGVLQPIITFVCTMMTQFPSTPQEHQVRLGWHYMSLYVCVGVGVCVWVCVHVQGQLCCSLAPVSVDDHTCCPITFRIHSDVTPEPFAERSSELCRPSPGYGTYAFEQCVGHFCSIKPLPHVSV